jgi:hypothetical protein
LKAKELPSAQLDNFTRTTIFRFWTFVTNKALVFLPFSGGFVTVITWFSCARHFILPARGVAPVFDRAPLGRLNVIAGPF